MDLIHGLEQHHDQDSVLHNILISVFISCRVVFREKNVDRFCMVILLLVFLFYSPNLNIKGPVL